MSLHPPEPARPFLFTRGGLVFLGFLLIGGFFLWTEHRAHVLLAASYWPWLLLLACPVLHLFMHGGHGKAGHGQAGHGSGPDEPDARA